MEVTAEDTDLAASSVSLSANVVTCGSSCVMDINHCCFFVEGDYCG